MNQIGTKYILAQRFVFDPNNNSLTDQTNNNEIIRLGSNESRILLMLSERPNQVISRDQLHEFVWREQGFQVDDSSLTQAISTLRKMIGDSTKSPAFVKTVPKRGYQLIASVSVAEATGEKLIQAEEKTTNFSSSGSTTSLKTASGIASSDTGSSSGASLSSMQESKSLLIKIVLLIAVILPIAVYLTAEPARSRFRLIDTIDLIPLMTPEGHPPLDAWHEQIKQCVSVYRNHHKEARRPQKVIVTAGPRNNIMLNVVHSEAYASENVTIQLVASQQDLVNLCN